jgi:hypothetical protein
VDSQEVMYWEVEMPCFSSRFDRLAHHLQKKKKKLKEKIIIKDMVHRVLKITMQQIYLALTERKQKVFHKKKKGSEAARR